MGNRSHYLLSLAFRYAKAGQVESVRRIQQELSSSDSSSRQGKRASADVLGYIAYAYANAGKSKEANTALSDLTTLYANENMAILQAAPGWVAEAQAEHGDLSSAIHNATTIANENPYPLMKILSKLVRNHNLVDAQKIIRSLKDWLQQYAKWGIVAGQRELGDLKSAKETAETIKPGHAKALAFLELANHLATAGDKPTALRLLRTAAESAASTVNDWARADALWLVAASMANAGDSDNAIKLAKSIEKDGHKRFAISDIVKAQAEQGMFKEAFDTAQLLQPTDAADLDGTVTYGHSIAGILAQLAKHGHAKEAKDTVVRFAVLKPRHRYIHSAIAAAQAESGNIPEALSTLSSAETPEQRAARKKEMSRLLSLLSQQQNSEALRQLRMLQSVDDDTRHAYESIALAYVKQGSLSKAAQVAVDLDSHYRGELFRDIGKVAAEGNKEALALAWARELPSSTDKAYALIGIAGGLWKTQRSTLSNSQAFH